MAPPPPPPPPPSCFPFTRSKSSGVGSSREGDPKARTRTSLGRSHTISSASTVTSKAEKLTFTSDSISWDNVPVDDTTRSPKKSPMRSPTGSGRIMSNPLSPITSRLSGGSQGQTRPPGPSPLPSRSNSSGSKSKGLFNPFNLTRNNSSSSTLVGSAYERKVADAMVPPEPRVDTGPKLVELRKLMAKENVAFYIVPSTDAHGSEYLAPCDKRRQWLTGFTGSAGTAVVSMTDAYLFVDSRYYIQAARQIDDHWTLMRVGWDGMKNWDEWIIDHARGLKIGIDSRMISLEATTKLVAALTPLAASLIFPWQNLVDLVWKERPVRPKDPIYVQPPQFTGVDARYKLALIRDFIQRAKPPTERFSVNPPKDKDIPIALFLADLADIAWTLNLRGSDIPYTPVFMSYLFVGMDSAVLFIENGKIGEEVREYLVELGVQTKEYSEVWPFLRGKDWGTGKVLISPEVPYTVARSLTSLRYTAVPPFVAMRRMVKNDVELAGMERAYLRDGAAMVRWLAWLDEKITQGYEVDEYQAAMRLKEFRAQGELYQGLAYEAIAATGPNAALPHYVPPRHGSLPIDRKTPFLIDAGGQYRDGTCDTTRTVHFGRPTDQQAEAFTRVLQGHIAIDTAIFPEGTSGAKLDVLARRGLWQDGLNYLHGTGHGVGSFLSVHELHIGFGSSVPLEPGYVVSNEPGFYLEGEFGVRIESVLAVQRVRTKNEFQGPIWLAFKRLTQVPIQLKLIKASMLSKEEKAWVRNHNEECRRKLEPLLYDDKRALRWLRKECQPAFRSETSVSGVSIEWD